MRRAVPLTSLMVKLAICEVHPCWMSKVAEARSSLATLMVNAACLLSKTLFRSIAAGLKRLASRIAQAEQGLWCALLSRALAQ